MSRPARRAGSGPNRPTNRPWRDRFPAHLSGAEPYGAARRAGGRGLLLDANENALGPVGAGTADAADALHRYPDPSGGSLRGRLAAYLGVEVERLWIGSGADDAIDVLLRTLLTPAVGCELVTISPTYDLYGQRATAHGVGVRAIRLDPGFDLDLEAMIDAAADAPLVMLCSPNNPTGRRLDREKILALLEATDAIVAVDEAYVEFSDGASLASRAGTGGPCERLVVIRTFSKAWGLAGLRTGYLVGAPPLVAMMDVVGLPYRLTAPAIRLATAALEAEADMERRCAWLRAERRRVSDSLAGLGLRVLPSDANFVLFFVDDPAAVQGRLATCHGITIRRRDAQPGLEGGLRVTIGARDDNDRFLTALAEALS